MPFRIQSKGSSYYHPQSQLSKPLDVTSKLLGKSLLLTPHLTTCCSGIRKCQGKTCLYKRVSIIPIFDNATLDLTFLDCQRLDSLSLENYWQNQLYLFLSQLTLVTHALSGNTICIGMPLTTQSNITLHPTIQLRQHGGNMGLGKFDWG